MTAHVIGLLMADVAMIIVVAQGAGWLAVRLGQPPVLGEIVGGILLGPTLLGPAATAVLFPTPVRAALTPLADLGLALFMFGVGYELDRRLIRNPAAGSVAAGSMLLPFGLGVALAGWLAGRHHPANEMAFVLFVGIAVAITAFPVLSRIVVDWGMANTRVGGLALSSAALGDVAAWSLLAVVLSLVSGQRLWLPLLFLPLLVALFTVVRPLLARLLPRCSVPQAMTVLAVGMLLTAATTELLGLHFIFGAFLFGVISPRHSPGWLKFQVVDRLTSVGGQLLLPVFFVVAGLDLDLRHLNLAGVGELAALLLISVVSKLVGGYGGARLHRLPAREAGQLAVLMNARGLTEIVVLTVGLQAGLIDARLYSLLVVMALVTTAMTGPMLRVLRVQRGREATPSIPAASAAAESQRGS